MVSDMTCFSKTEIETLMFAVEVLIDRGGNVDSMEEFVAVYRKLEKLWSQK